MKKEKQFIKRTGAFIISALILGSAFTALPQGFVDTGIVAHAESFVYGDFGYVINNDGTVTITEYNGSAAALSIPSTIDGKAVKSISSYVFINSSITEVTLPYGMTKVNYFAFYGARKLKTVNLPNTVTSIGEAAFEFCTSLETVNYNCIDSIEKYAFYGCTSLSSFPLKYGLKSVGLDAFTNCGLTSVEIPSTLTAICGRAFGFTYSHPDYSPVEGFKVIGLPDSDAELYANDY